MLEKSSVVVSGLTGHVAASASKEYIRDAIMRQQDAT
jgi:hypothetical protein